MYYVITLWMSRDCDERFSHEIQSLWRNCRRCVFKCWIATSFREVSNSQKCSCWFYFCCYSSVLQNSRNHRNQQMQIIKNQRKRCKLNHSKQFKWANEQLDKWKMSRIECSSTIKIFNSKWTIKKRWIILVTEIFSRK